MAVPLACIRGRSLLDVLDAGVCCAVCTVKQRDDNVLDLSKYTFWQLLKIQIPSVNFKEKRLLIFCEYPGYPQQRNCQETCRAAGTIAGFTYGRQGPAWGPEGALLMIHQRMAGAEQRRRATGTTSNWHWCATSEKFQLWLSFKLSHHSVFHFDQFWLQFLSWSELDLFKDTSESLHSKTNSICVCTITEAAQSQLF